jgi:hypothetical protein
VRQEKDAKRMAIGVPLSAIRLGRAAESKMKQDAAKGKGSAADNSGARVKFSKSSEVFKQLVTFTPLPKPNVRVISSADPPPSPPQQNEKSGSAAGGGAHLPVKHSGTASSKPASAYKM